MGTVGKNKAKRMVDAGDTYVYGPRHDEMNRLEKFATPDAAQRALEEFCAKYALEGGSVVTFVKTTTRALEQVADKQGHCRQLFAKVDRVAFIEVVG